MANTNNQQSIFPDLPREAPLINKDGQMSYLWSLGFSSLFQALQKNFKNEGILFPSLTTAQATSISDNYKKYYIPTSIPLPPGVEDISGQTIYNKTIEAPQIFIISYDTSTPPKVTGARWWTFTIT